MCSEANAIARMINATVTRPDQRLEGLRAVATNRVIESFPLNVTEIGIMSGMLSALGRVLPEEWRAYCLFTVATVSRVLEELGQPTGGSVVEKRRRLKLLTGVVLQVVA